MHVDASLARRLEQHEALFAARIAQAFRAADPACGAAVFERAGAIAAWVGQPSVLSKVFALGLDGEPADADLDAIEEFYLSRGARRVVIELSPFAGVALAARLEARGYRTSGLEQVQARALAPADAALATGPLPPGVTLGPVDPADGAARADWERVASAGFFAPAPAPPDLVRYGELVSDIPGNLAWLARVEGAPAAVGGTAIADGICALFAGATLPGFRGRGCHHALVAARLAAGARAGATVATVGAKPGGESQRHLHALGFGVAYTRPARTRAWE